MSKKTIRVLTDVNNWNPIWLILPGLVTCISLHWLYISRAQPQVPYMDTMLFFVQIDQILRDEISWWSIYGSGDHRGFLYPFVTAIEWALWNVDARISTCLTGFVVAATFHYWLRALLCVRKDALGESYTGIKTVLTAIAAAFIIVSPAAFELWTLDLGFGQLIKNFLIVLFFYQMSISRPWKKNIGGALLFGFWGSFLILFATYGWSYPFLSAVTFGFVCIAYSEPHTRLKATTVLILMFSAQYLYVRLGQGVFSGGQNASQSLAVAELIKGFLYGAGSSFMGVESMVKAGIPVGLAMFLGAALLACVCIALFAALVAPTPTRIFAGALLIFSLIVLVGVTLARGSSNYLNTGASRYFVDYVWLLLAPSLILVKPGNADAFRSHFVWRNHLLLQKIYKTSRVSMSLLLILALLGHIKTWQIELETAPFRAAIFKSMAEIYRAGVTQEAEASLLQSPYSIAKQGVIVAQKYKLANVKKKEIYCTLKQAEYAGDWFMDETSDTRWMGRKGQITLGHCMSEINLKGFIPSSFSPRKLYISYGDRNTMIVLTPGKEFHYRLGRPEDGNLVVTLDVDRTTSPLAEGLGADQRELGVLLTYIGN